MPATSTKNIAILCNALAGNGNPASISGKIESALSARQIRYQIFDSNWPEWLNDFTDVFLIGGDGTINYFVNRYPGVQIPVTFFKGGTGNDFHWLLYGDVSIEQQVQTGLGGVCRKTDIAKCNDQYFVNGIGIGFEGAVVRSLTGRKKRPGKTSFLLSILKNIFTYRSNQFIIQYNGQRLEGRKLLVDITNGRRAGGGFHIAPVASAQDGLLDLVVADALSPLQRLRYLPVIEKGKHLQLPFIHHAQVKRISVESGHPVPYHLDGEYFVARRFEITILPGALTIK